MIIYPHSHRSIHILTSLKSATLVVQKSWFVFCTEAFSEYSLILANCHYTELDVHVTGKGGTQYFLHMFKILSSTWTYIWCNRVYHSHWHLVCWMCSSWTSPRTGWSCSPFKLICSFIRLIDVKYGVLIMSYLFVPASISWGKWSRPACWNH